ncbi:MAG: hypothetical protein LBF12_00395 [Christensenellaceae bacterium]|jgi:hypothetical protein|nr:hypothetical protein [Christensenellaceae bacterium]
MLAKKKIVISIILVLFSLVALLTFTACNKTEKIQLNIYSDIMPKGSESVVVFGLNKNDKKSSTATYELDASGSTVINDFSTGTYESVTITRLGCEQVLYNVTIDSESYFIDLFNSTKITYSSEEAFIEFHISNATQLDNINLLTDSNVSLTFSLTNDILLANSTVQIDTLNATLDGAGHRISGLNISSTDSNNVALIGVNNGVVQNVELLNANISGKNNVGGLVGTNFGTISNVTITNVVATGTKFVGALCGLDYGIIETISVANSSVSSLEGYYGSIAGFSFTNIGLGAYGIRPDLTATTPITDSMSDLEILKTGISNWTLLPDRSKFLEGDFYVDFADIIKIASSALSTYQGDYSTFMELVMTLISNVVNIVNHTEAKLIYSDSNIENSELGEAVGILSSYIAYDTVNSRLAGLFDNQISFGLLNYYLSTTDFGVTAEEIKEFLFDNPQSGAAYYRQSDDYLRFTAADTTDTSVDKSTGYAIVSFNKTYYTAIVREEIEKQGKIENLAALYTQFALDYVEEAKKYLFLGDFIEWENVTDDMFSDSSKSHNNGIYTLEFTTVPDELMKDFVAFFNKAIAEFEDIVISEHQRAGLASPVGHGTCARVVFLNDENPPTIKAEVFDNGFIRYWELNNFYVKVEIVLEPIFQQTIAAEARAQGFNFTASVISFDLKFIEPYVNLYSYSKSDSDIELILEIFKGKEETLSNALERRRRPSESDNNEIIE